VDWFTSAGVGSGGRIVDWTLNVNENRSTTYFVLEAGNLREVISQNSLNTFGEPYGLDGAVAYMEVRKEVVQAELAVNNITDVEIKTDQYTLPESTIYVLSSPSRLSAIDADTGKERWATLFGSSRFPSIGIGAGNDYLAAINGSTLYCFEAATGKVLWSHACEFGVAAAPAVSETHIYVPLLNGRLEVFEIADKGYGSYPLVAGGGATARPLLTENTVSWPTNKGYLNVAASSGPRQHSIAFRLAADGPIVSSPVSKEKILFATSLDGFTYAIEERRGSLLWEISTGSEITQSPVVLGDNVYAVTDDFRLFRLDAHTGQALWAEPMKNIGRYLGAGAEKIYLTDGFGELLVVDPNSAAILSRIGVGEIGFILPNRQTDRLYIATKSGIIQCLREISSPIPHFHGSEILESKAVVKPMPQPGDKSSTTIAAENDPFNTLGSGDSTPSEKITKEDDPFAVKDPAGSAPKPGDDDDPFKIK
jgi:outer membrane protein assembly factor BamB